MDESKKDLMELFLQLEALLHRYQGYHFRQFGPLGNPLRGQGRILAMLKRQPEISQKELGYLLDMRNQSLGELLAKLERNGYITRTPSEEDRRTMNIKLTPEGAEAAENIDPTRIDIHKVFTCLNEEEQNNLSLYLERLITELENQLHTYAIEGQALEHPMPEHCFGQPSFGPQGRGHGHHYPSHHPDPMGVQGPRSRIPWCHPHTSGHPRPDEPRHQKPCEDNFSNNHPEEEEKHHQHHVSKEQA